LEESIPEENSQKRSNLEKDMFDIYYRKDMSPSEGKLISNCARRAHLRKNRKPNKP